MRYVEYKLTLDLHCTSPQGVIHAVKGNTACRLNITLTEQGKPYKVEDGCTAVFKGVKPDNNKLYNPCEIVDGKVVYLFTEQTVVLPGMVNCEIRLSDAEGKLLYTPKFDIALADTAFDDDEIPVESKGESLSLGEFEELVAETKKRLDKGEFDGVGITSVEQTTISVDDRGVNVITFNLSDGTSYDVQIRNGSSAGLTDDEKNAIAEDIAATLFPVGIENGGTGATAVLDALHNLGILASGINLLPTATVTQHRFVQDFAWYTGASMTTAEFMQGMPINTAIVCMCSLNADSSQSLVDSPAPYTTMILVKGANNNYRNGIAWTANASVPKIWVYSSNGSGVGNWKKIITAADFTLTNGVLHINTL